MPLSLSRLSGPAASRLYKPQAHCAMLPMRSNVACGSRSSVIRIIVDGITVEGTQLADEREALLWSLVNCFHAQIARLDRAVDRIVPQMRDLERAQDGTEVKAHELETLTDRARNLGDRRDAFEALRDTAADAYRVHTGDVWRPRHGSHSSQTGLVACLRGDRQQFSSRFIHRDGPRILPTRPYPDKLAPLRRQCEGDCRDVPLSLIALTRSTTGPGREPAIGSR